MTRIRGLSFKKYIGKIEECPNCGLSGYAELWTSYLSNSYFVTSVKHSVCIVGKDLTLKRCWLRNK